ncbi:hypothetical protein AB0I34_33885 [Kribbella sp. NPDC050281]|uniref:hypothetical protein n=1 Tax=Kribbella sp. NPDC050281 TaxID=3155515 RepID=UPI00340A1720
MGPQINYRYDIDWYLCMTSTSTARVFTIDHDLDLIVRGEISLSAEGREIVDRTWTEKARDNPTFHNGELLSLSGLRSTEGRWVGDLRCTTFAHYLANREQDLPAADTCCPVAVNVLPITSDGRALLADVGKTSSSAGKVKFIGGGATPADVVDGVLDVQGVMRRELDEEFPGLNEYWSTAPRLEALLVGGNRRQVVLLFVGRLRISEAEARTLYLGSADPDQELSGVLAVVLGTAGLHVFNRREGRRSLDYVVPALMAQVRADRDGGLAEARRFLDGSDQ